VNEDDPDPAGVPEVPEVLLGTVVVGEADPLPPQAVNRIASPPISTSAVGRARVRKRRGRRSDMSCMLRSLDRKPVSSLRETLETVKNTQTVDRGTCEAAETP
jgi:hypothetical protein